MLEFFDTLKNSENIQIWPQMTFLTSINLIFVILRSKSYNINNQILDLLTFEFQASALAMLMDI